MTRHGTFGALMAILVSAHGCAILPSHIHSPVLLETAKAARESVEALTKDDLIKRMRTADDDLERKVIESLLGARGELARLEAERMTYQGYTFGALEDELRKDIGGGVTATLYPSAAIENYEKAEAALDQLARHSKRIVDALTATDAVDWSGVASSLRLMAGPDGLALKALEADFGRSLLLEPGGAPVDFGELGPQAVTLSTTVGTEPDAARKRALVEGFVAHLDRVIPDARTIHPAVIARARLRRAEAALRDPVLTSGAEAAALDAARKRLAGAAALTPSPVRAADATTLASDLSKLADGVVADLAAVSVTSTPSVDGQRQGLAVLALVEMARTVLAIRPGAPRRLALVDEEEKLKKRVEAARKARAQFQKALDGLLDGLEAGLKLPERSLEIQRLRTDIRDLEQGGASGAELEKKRAQLAKLEADDVLSSKLARGMDELVSADLPAAAQLLGPVVDELSGQWESWKRTFEAARKLATPAERLFYLELLLEQVRRDLALLVEEERAATERQRLAALLEERKTRAQDAATKIQALVDHLRATDATRFASTRPLRDSILDARLDASNAADARASLAGQDQLRDVLRVALLVLQIKVTLASEMRAIIAKTAFLEKQHKTFQHEIQLKHRYGLIRVSVDSLAAYHQGGLKPEHVAQIISILQTAGIAIIAL